METKKILVVMIAILSVISITAIANTVNAEEIEQRIWPSEAPVDTCKDGAGNPHSTTGENSADWFLYGGAGDWKIFDVIPGSQIHIHSRGDSCPGCVLWHINYYLDDYYGGAWHEVTFIDGPDQKGAEHDHYYVPIGDRVRIRATSGFYVAVYGLKFSDGEKIVPSSN